MTSDSLKGGGSPNIFNFPRMPERNGKNNSQKLWGRGGKGRESGRTDQLDVYNVFNMQAKATKLGDFCHSFNTLEDSGSHKKRGLNRVNILRKSV